MRVCIRSNSVFALEGPLTPSVHCILCRLTTSPPSSAALCVFNTMTLFHREGLTRSGRYGSFTSRAGRTTACPITPRACWGLLGESSPRPWPTRGPWWFTAGRCALELITLCHIRLFLLSLTTHYLCPSVRTGSWHYSPQSEEWKATVLEIRFVHNCKSYPTPERKKKRSTWRIFEHYSLGMKKMILLVIKLTDKCHSCQSPFAL